MKIATTFSFFAAWIASATLGLGEVAVVGTYDPPGDNDVDQSGSFASGTGNVTEDNVLDVTEFTALVADAFDAGTGGVLGFDSEGDARDSATAFTSAEFGGGTSVTFNFAGGQTNVGTGLGGDNRVPTSNLGRISRTGFGGTTDGDFDFSSFVVNGAAPGAGLTHFGATVIHRVSNQTWNVSAEFSGGGTLTFSPLVFTGSDTPNTLDTFFGVVAPAGETIARVTFSGGGSFTFLDDVGFITNAAGGGGGPEITDFQVAPNTVELTFSTIPGNQYQIQRGTMLNDFAPVETVIAAGSSETYLRTGVALLDREFFRVEDMGPAPPLFQEDFEPAGDGTPNDGGFTVATTSGTAWEHGLPDSNGLGGTVDAGAGGSAGAWGTNLGNASVDPADPDFDEGFYVADTRTRLRSPVIDLTGVTSATLSFDQALDIEGNDRAVVNIIDDTTDTAIIEELHVSTDGDITSAAWARVSGLVLPAEALGRPIRLEFEFTGDGGSSLNWMGWYIDNVTIDR